MAAGSKTGRAGFVQVNNVTIPITSWKTKGTKELADSTDSSNWDTASAELYKSQLPGALALEGTLEGYWDSGTTGTGVIGKLKADAPLPITFQYDRATNAFSGNFDLSDVEVTVQVPGASVINFTANFRSNGVFQTY
jgi:hypothetical protein